MGFSGSCLPDLQDEQCALFFVFFVPFVAFLFSSFFVFNT